MAIKRCPYCRALIDEKEQYCNNCGTQLLFPEDGAVEEEIPGDKIIESDVEEKEYEIPEPDADKPAGDADKAPEVLEANEDEEDEEEQELDAGAEPEEDEEEDEDEEDDEPDEEEREEVIVVDDDKKPNTSEMPAMFSAPGRDDTAGEEEPEPEEPEGKAAEAPPLSVEAGPIPEKPVREPEPGPAAPPPPAKKPLTFDTSDLDKIGRTAELGKEQVENFLDILKEREIENRLGRVAPREPEEELPPWAEGIKEGAAEPAGEVKVEMVREEEAEDRELGERESREEEETPVEIEEKEPPRARKRRVADSGIGLPEKVTQADLPFEREIPRDEAPAAPAVTPAARRPMMRDEVVAEDLEEEEAEAVEERPRPPFRLTVFLKAKAFDILFVAVFWLASLWAAARSLDVTLFQMLGKASSGLLAYFGALLVLYFFLFYFFLGETLGDRLFRDTD